MPFLDRPQASVMFAALQPNDAVVTPKMDRAFRSAIDALSTLDRLKQIPVALHLMDQGGDTTNSLTGKMIFTVLSAIAEMERGRIGERIREVKRDQKSRNQFLGGKVPFGFTVDESSGKPVLVPDTLQQGAIAYARELHQDGMALRKIAAALGARGFNVSHQGVKDFLARVPKVAAE
jgi:DNA invertase Pin-like site-specific DNA recombinase